MPKINQLKPATSLANTDIMIADTSTGSDTRKIAYSDLRTQVQNESKSVFALKGETATDEQVTTAVTNWLDTNVDPVGSAVVVDKTLSIDGAAADAKTTGDGIADLKSAISEPEFSWQIGRYISGSGVIGNDSKYAASTKILVQPGDSIRAEINGSHSDKTLWFVYYNDDTFVSRIAGSTSNDNVVPNGANTLRFSIATSATMTAEIASDFQFTFYSKPMARQESLKLKQNLYNYNCTDILEGRLRLINDRKDASFNIVANGDNSFTFWGTAGSGGNFNVFQSLNNLPDWIEVGKTYYFSNTSENIYFEVYPMNGSNIIPGTSISVRNDKKAITIPENCNGIIIRFRITAGTYSRETANVHGFDSLTNQELTQRGTSVNNYEFNSYNNTYTVTATPTISQISDYYLQPTGDSTDVTAAIVTMLTNNKVCRLGPGNYYISDLVMPNNTMIIGCGKSTKLIRKGTDAGFGIKLGSGCTVKDLWLMGADEITPSETIGNRHGILWQGNYTESRTAPNRSIVDGVYITSFTGGGITLYDTGYSVRSCIEVSNSYIFNCGAGINISYWSEFNKFTAVHSSSNYYGCINNGGNNVFIGCDFSGNKVGMLIDNSQGQSPNNSHGTCSACLFNHSDSNNGYGIKILNCDNGFIFEGCQIFYSQILIEDSDGVSICNSNFGSTNCDITIDGGGVVLFANNLYQDAPSISVSNNAMTHFVNCYVRSTGAVVSN